VDESPLQKRETTQPVKPVAEADLRASDADRDRVADILRDALAEGRLTTEEHSERLDGVYAAKTVGELEPYVRDLPAPGAAPAAAPASGPYPWAADGTGENPNLIGILGGAERKGRWRVGRSINAVAIMGGVEIDLTEATFTAPELVITCTAIMGGVSIKLPENVSVHGNVVGIMGGADIKRNDFPDPGAPVIKIQGFALMGGVDAKPKRGKRLKPHGSGPSLEK